MPDYSIIRIDDVVLDNAQPDGLLDGFDLMSPYVWTVGAEARLLVRVLPNPLGPTDPTGVIYSGTSLDWLHFRMNPEPAIAPGPSPDDAGGVEDPTVVISESDELLVYYTGVDAARKQGSMMVARGCSLTDLKEQRVVLKAPEGEGNIKEATIAKGADGRFRLFYEYAKDNASRIGMAIGRTPDGPWDVVDDPFGVRPESWDNWHLSTGPVVQMPGSDPVMFYNGATADARWRIGWITFDANFERVTGRGIEPMLVPPPPEHRDATDIAFAASCLVEEDRIYLYYSLEDRILRRATIHRYA